MLTIRYRSITWFAAGAAIMMIVVVAFQALGSTAAGPAGQSVFVPTEPCRLFDYRPAPDTVGTRTSPLGPNETHTQQVTGKVGNCDIPAGASAIAMNVTAVTPTAQSNLRLFPADQTTPPLVSNLNYSAGQKPVPNKVDVKLSPTGAIKLLNFRGSVFVIGDVVGYYVSSPLTDLEAKVAALEAANVAQEKEIADLKAANDGQDASINQNRTDVDHALSEVLRQESFIADNILAIDALRTKSATVRSGTTIRGTGVSIDELNQNDATGGLFVEFGMLAPSVPTKYAFAPEATTGTGDIVLDVAEDPACTGTNATPSAPAGTVCIYLQTPSLSTNTNIDNLVVLAPAGVDDVGTRSGFGVFWQNNATPPDSAVVSFTWAYTAP